MEMLIACDLELQFLWCLPNENDFVTNECDIFIFPESR